jgi:hypothetical protein
MKAWQYNRYSPKAGLLAAGLLLTFLLLVLAGGAYAAVTAYSTPKHVLHAGGPSTGGGFALQQVVGEPVTGYSTGGSYTLCAGYLCGATIYKHYLPLSGK